MSMSLTPGATLAVLKLQLEAVKKQAPRAGQRQADLRYMQSGLESAIEAIEFLVQHEAAVTRAAKRNVPWRAS